MAQQLMLPIIPSGATEINNHVSVWRGEERWTYFLGLHPIYSHHPSDQLLFRLCTSLLIESGACRQIEIIKTFGVSKSSVDRSVRLLRAKGAEGFFKPRKVHYGGTVLTPEKLEKAQHLLQQHADRHEIAAELEVPYDTLRKAISAGRLVVPAPPETATTKSSRNVVDAQAAVGMGTACTRVEERTLAAFGGYDGAPVRFEPCLDVPRVASCAPCQRFWRMVCWRDQSSCLARLRGITRVFIFCCYWRSWPCVVSRRLRSTVGMRRENSAR